MQQAIFNIMKFRNKSFIFQKYFDECRACWINIYPGAGEYMAIYILYGVSFKAVSVFSNEKLGNEFDIHARAKRG